MVGIGWGASPTSTHPETPRLLPPREALTETRLVDFQGPEVQSLQAKFSFGTIQALTLYLIEAGRGTWTDGTSE